MGRHRESLPPLPLDKLSSQQLLVYELSKKYSTREISTILSLTEKHVRQIYSVIRLKSNKFANEFELSLLGAEPAHFYERIPIESNSIGCDFIRERFTKEVNLKMSLSRIPFSAEMIERIENVAKKKYQRRRQNICNTIIKLDTKKTYVKINFSLVIIAMERMNLTREQLSKCTNISMEQLSQIEIDGIVSYRELFSLIKCLEFNPYGPSEKDYLMKKLNDRYLVKMNRLVNDSDKNNIGFIKRRNNNRLKSRYRNKVLYYGTASYHYNSNNRNVPIIEDGRNGLFPVKLSRKQQQECGWILKNLKLKPVYTYRYPRLKQELKYLNNMLANSIDEVMAKKYKAELVNLLEDIAPEDGSAIFIMDKGQLTAINKILIQVDSYL